MGRECAQGNPANLWAAVLGGLRRWGPVWAPQQILLSLYQSSSANVASSWRLYRDHVGDVAVSTRHRFKAEEAANGNAEQTARG
jgi:hypothetical protein